MEKRTRKGNKRFCSVWGYAVFAAALLTVVLCALRFGSVRMPQRSFFAALFFADGEEMNTKILYLLRFPRVLAALLAGMALSAAGVLLQNVTNNPLASPNVIGVNAGAGTGVVCVLALLPTAAIGFLPLFAFMGAFLTTLTVVLVAERAGGGRAAIVLAGVAVTALLNAFISALTLVFPDLLVSYNAFSVGGFRDVLYGELAVPALIVAVGLIVAFVVGGRLDLLSMGEDMAHTMGINARFLRVLALLLASALAGAAVSFAGLLGFVGLIVPHVARALVGSRLRPLLAASLLLGGSVTVLADLLGRVLLAPTEIPVGIMMAAVGAPFFLCLLFWKRGRLQ